MNRRGFFRRTFGAMATAALAPLFPKAPAPLMFHSKAFVFAMDPMTHRFVSRLDVIHGIGTFNQSLAVRIQDS